MNYIDNKENAAEPLAAIDGATVARFRRSEAAKASWAAASLARAAPQVSSNVRPIRDHERRDQMETPNVMDSMFSHLEFLGYKVTRTDNAVRAEGSSFPRVVRFSERASGIIFSASVGCSDNAKGNRPAFLEWVNTINRMSALITAFAQEGDLLTFTGWFPKLYDKEAFGTFFQTFRDDIHTSIYGKDAKTEEFLK